MLGLSAGFRYADVAAAEDGRAPALSFIPPSSQYGDVSACFVGGGGILAYFRNKQLDS